MALRGPTPTSKRKKASPLWMKKKSTGECVLGVLPNDVLLGRGSGPNDHKGNIQFRELIKERKEEYSWTNNRQAKVAIASDIVHQIFQSGGRFLKKLDDAKAANVLPKVLERLRRKQQDNYEEDFDNHNPRDVYEIQGAAIVMEKTKQALRQGQQKGPKGGRSPTSQRSLTSSQSTTPLNRFISVSDGSPPNGFIGGGNDVITTTNNQHFNNNKFSSSFCDFNVNAKEELLSIKKNITPMCLLPPLFSTNEQQQQDHPSTNPTPFMSLQQQLYKLEQQQRLQEEKHQLEKKKYELQQLELEKQKQSFKQNLVLRLQQGQLGKLQESQKINHHHSNNQNSNLLTTTNNQKDLSEILTDEFAPYTTTLAEMEDTRATSSATDLLSNSNNDNDKHRNYARTWDSEHSLGDVTKILKGSSTGHSSDDDGDDTHDKNFDNISTMMLSMKNFSVKDSESQHSRSTLGTIDGLSDDNMVGGFLTTGLMSVISIMSMTNKSTDSLFRSKLVDSRISTESSQNASWDAATDSSFDHSKNMFSSIIGVTCH